MIIDKQGVIDDLQEVHDALVRYVEKGRGAAGSCNHGQRICDDADRELKTLSLIIWDLKYRPSVLSVTSVAK